MCVGGSGDALITPQMHLAVILILHCTHDRVFLYIPVHILILHATGYVTGPWFVADLLPSSSAHHNYYACIPLAYC